MAASPDETYLRDFYRGVQEHPFLQPDSRLVVDFHSRMGTDDRIANDPIAFLMKDILWSASNSSLKMLSGFRGSGKTTELLRLHKRLREERYVVLYIGFEDYVEVKQPLADDPNDEQGDVALVTGPAAWWERVRDTLGRNAEFKGGSINLGAAKIDVELRENPEFRARSGRQSREAWARSARTPTSTSASSSGRSSSRPAMPAA